MWPTLSSLSRTLSGKARSRPAPGPRPARRRPVLEPLEGRDCPSGGLLDPTFASGGIVNLPTTTDNGASAVVVQSDGKVVVAGYVTRNTGYSSISVQRLNRDGSLDTTFNRTGSVTIQTGNDDIPRAVALQPDGKILVGGGWSGNHGSGGGLVARLNANGTLDTTFGSKGLWLSTAADRVNKLAVLTDPAHPTTLTGIVAADDASANGARCIGVVKLTPIGKPDTTFGTGGVAVFANLAGGGDRRTGSVAVAPSGEIYLAGYVQLSGMTAPDGCVAAVTPAGALDTTFGGEAGYILADPTGSQESEFYDLAVQTLTVNGQPVNRLLAAGYIVTPNQTGFIAAYTLGGAVDTTFGTGGSFTYTNPPGALGQSLFRSLALEADGSIVLGGTQNYTAADGSNPFEMLVGHLTAAGAADTSFGTAGTGFVAVQDGQSSNVWGLAIDPSDGGILLSGFSYSSSTSTSHRQAAVVRLTAP